MGFVLGELRLLEKDWTWGWDATLAGTREEGVDLPSWPGTDDETVDVIWLELHIIVPVSHSGKAYTSTLDSFVGVAMLLAAVLA